VRRRDLLGLAPAILGAQQNRPNVLFLFADDQRTDTISALGNPHIRTPTLDGLVRRGFTFNNAYCMGSNIGAVCLPSRNMLMSGRAYFRFQRYASGEDPNFPVSMAEAGYETYHHGKRGNSAIEIQKKFEHLKYDTDQDSRLKGEPGKAIIDEAIDFVGSRSQSRPFFMYLAFASPHDPRVAADHYMRLYQRDRIPLPRNYMPLHPFNNGEQLVRDELLADFPRTRDEVRKHLHDYYAVITALDGHIGRLLKAIPSNTIILYSADHGLAMGSHGLMGKQSLYDHSMKAPLIYAGPGIRHGRSDALTYLTDIFPTVVDLAGGRVPAGLDGRSMRSVIEGREKKGRESLLLAYRDVQRAYRDDRWKLIRYPQINRTQLFDLQRDPDEMRDLSGEPGQQNRVERMMAAMGGLQKQFGDTQPLTSPSPAEMIFKAPTADEVAAYRKKWKM
jgi:arylsulfatase A-like enzyme